MLGTMLVWGKNSDLKLILPYPKPENLCLVSPVCLHHFQEMRCRHATELLLSSIKFPPPPTSSLFQPGNPICKSAVILGHFRPHLQGGITNIHTAHLQSANCWHNPLYPLPVLHIDRQADWARILPSVSNPLSQTVELHSSIVKEEEKSLV